MAGRIARSHRDAQRRQGLAHALGLRADAGERCAEVALDVVVKRLEGRNVQQANARARLVSFLRQLPVDLVDAPEKGGQGLARAGGRKDERVLAARDGRPAPCLRRRGRAEMRLEPAPGRRREERRQLVVSVGSGWMQRHLDDLLPQEPVRRLYPCPIPLQSHLDMTRVIPSGHTECYSRPIEKRFSCQRTIPATGIGFVAQSATLARGRETLNMTLSTHPDLWPPRV